MNEMNLKLLKDSLQDLHKEYSARRIKMFEELFKNDDENGELILEVLSIVKRHTHDDEYKAFIKYLTDHGLQIILSKSDYNQLIFINRLLYKLIVDLYYKNYSDDNDPNVTRIVANFISKLNEVDNWVSIFAKELLPILLILNAFKYLKGGIDEGSSENKEG